jgi:tetratricopeptide (TPR) repeat protein
MAIQLDPLSTRHKGSMGSAYYFMGRYKEGIQKTQEFLKHHPNDNFLLWSLGYNYAGNGECEKAIETFKKRTVGTHTNWAYVYCYVKLGKMDEARRILDYHIERKKSDHVPDFMMSAQYASLGEIDLALDYLEKSIEVVGENWFINGYMNDPMLKPIRSHPRFKSLTENLKEMYKI